MLYRARHKPSKCYSHVTVDPRWLKFENFLADMGECPDGHTLDRKENSKGYSPDNCRWATQKTQAENRTVTDWLVCKNQKKTLSEWSREIGIPRLALFARIYQLGWSVERAIETPLRKFNGLLRKNGLPPPAC